MSPAPAFRLPPEEPPALHDRAIDNLQFIRDTMERAGAFTAVPGWGGVGIGLTALAASVVAGHQPTMDRWMMVWFAEAAVAVVIAGVALYLKSVNSGVPLFWVPARRFALNFAPPMVVGGILTVVLYRAGLVDAIPGTWLLLFGTGVVAGGAFSVPVVPAQGVCSMLIGTVALFAPSGWRDYLMAAGFGVVQMVFGLVIARRYGG
jgi:hypothetical protein